MFSSDGQRAHPNNVRMPDLVMGPTQYPPSGHFSQLPRVTLKYWSSLQSLGFLPPKSEHDEEPERVVSYPAGHALHEELGRVF